FLETGFTGSATAGLIRRGRGAARTSGSASRCALGRVRQRLTFCTVSGRPPDDAQRRADDVHLRTLIDNARLVVWSINREGIFTLSEGRGLKQLGLEPGKAVGLSAFELYKDFPDLLASIRRALAGEETVATLHAVGRVYETVSQPLRDGAGTITGLLGISTDITERHRA